MSMVCPDCKSEFIIEGMMVYNQIDYINPPAFFRNKGSFYSFFKNNIRFENKFNACASCGFAWTKINVDKLQQLIPGKS